MRMLIKILLLFVFGSLAFAQNADSLSKLQTKPDSISTLTKTETPQISAKQFSTKKAVKLPVKQHVRVAKEKSADKSELSIWSLIYMILLILAGYMLSNLLTLFRKFWFFAKYPVLNSLMIYLKSFIWIFVFYFIFSMFSEKLSTVMLGLILVIVVFVSVSSIKFLQNLVGGIYLNITNPFQKGDFIRIENYEGEVQKIELRTTTIISETNSMISVPNSLFLSVPVVNVNRGQIEQLITIDFEFPFEYTPNKIIKIIYEAALSSPYTYVKYKPKVFFRNSDFQKKMRIYQLQIFVFDGKYENELQHNLNLMIANSIEVTFGKQR